MRTLLIVIMATLILAGCAASRASRKTQDAIQQVMDSASQPSAKPGKPDAVNDALLPPLSVALPRVENKPLETKFDLTVNNTAASQVFTAIVSGTRYSILLHPEVSGNLSLNLKDVTVFDALEAIHEMYGYDYRVDGTRIYIQPLTMQTRIFQVNYLTGQRDGKSSLRVSSGSVSDATSGTSGQAASSEISSRESSKVSMTTTTDFWGELSMALKMIVGEEKGRSIVVSPMSGVIVVRAMPEELRNVTAYLKASQISIERQVILEAKIVEVQLNDSYQSGVNWASFTNGANRAASVGQIGAGGSLAPSVGGVPSVISGGGSLTSTPGVNLMNAASNIGGSLFGLAFQTSNFAALLNFLESQGNVHVLSSPRIATLNNQRAVLKVGTDEFFVTEITGGTQTTTTIAGTAPTVRVQPFFSGIALDVTPRIDENNEIILHVHPSVSTVSTVNKTVNLGTTMGTYNLPLASSSVSETDSVVRAKDGQIVAIGGLMRQSSVDGESGLPLLPKSLFGQTSKTTEKRELVILIKPTVVNSDKDWSDDITRSRDRFNNMSGKGE